MSTKTYKIKANNAVMTFHLGRATVRAEFKNGLLREDRYATLTTDSPVVQLAIERDERFGKVVFLARCSSDNDNNAEVQLQGQGTAPTVNDDGYEIIEGPQTLNDIVNYLRLQKNIDPRQLTTMAKIKKAVDELKLMFPNVSEVK